MSLADRKSMSTMFFARHEKRKPSGEALGEPSKSFSVIILSNKFADVNDAAIARDHKKTFYSSFSFKSRY